MAGHADDGEGTDVFFYSTLLRRFHFFAPEEEVETVATVPIL